ncbi:MAG: HD-GYP domain-containing protein [Candidatus Eremiobacteraeota bacterium]|nr:HD-GYP domain-containing protein [Candidatus Eremiobacteraeota bacterium]MCW5868355.1 HD-GYP domain-containing protein [Candidatus Eremiobacteraeota bacterium]
MWLDVSGINSTSPLMNRGPVAQGVRTDPASAMQRLQQVQTQRFLESSLDFSPVATRLAARQRHLETPSWMSSNMNPSKPARQLTSQMLAQQTWNWLGEAFPGCDKSAAAQSAALQQALREFSPGTQEHSKRVGELTLRFANDLGFDELEQEKLEKGCEFKEAGLLGLQIEAWSTAERKAAAESMRKTGKFHDIGKLAVPDHILHKEGPLTPEEREVIEMHPLVGEAILAGIPGFEEILPAVRHHHERWDGTGYVDGLKGEQIPIQAQLISLSDTFDALTEDRPYRKAMSIQQACQEILRQRGRQFDPSLAESFVALQLAPRP